MQTHKQFFIINMYEDNDFFGAKRLPKSMMT